MKQLILGLVATLAMGSVLAQQPTTPANVGVQVEVTGSAKVGGQTVASGASLGAKAGDVVIVSDGTAKVTYANGCAVTVVANAPYTISEKGPGCRKVAASSNTKYLAAGGIGLLLAGAAGGGGGGGGGDDKPSSP